MIRRLLAGALVVLTVAAVIAGFQALKSPVDPLAHWVALDRELLQWKSDLSGRAPIADEVLRPFAEQVGAPWPALRPTPGSARPRPDPEVALGTVCVETAQRLAAEGRPADAVELLLALIRYGEDACAGRGFDAVFQPAVEAGERALRDLIRDEALTGAPLEAAIAFERERLKGRPHPVEAWRYRVLEAQALLRDLHGGEAAPAEVDWAGPVDALLGKRDPDEDDFLRALAGVQESFPMFLTARRSDDGEGLAGIAARLREECAGEAGTLFARVASSILVYGDLARDNYESWLRTREARLFGMLMLRHREQHGAFPEALESIRVEEIPMSPHGGTWRLGIDRETKKPGVFLDGGRVYTYQVLAPEEGDFHSDRETKPLFSFR